jgi:hypothetical protein
MLVSKEDLSVCGNIVPTLGPEFPRVHHAVIFLKSTHGTPSKRPFSILETFCTTTLVCDLVLGERFCLHC